MQIKTTIKNTTTHLLEWPESRTLTTCTAIEDVEQRYHSLADGNAKWYGHFGR